MAQSVSPLIHTAVTLQMKYRRRGREDGVSRKYQMIQVVSNSFYLAQRKEVTTDIKYKNLLTILDCQSKNGEGSWLYTSTEYEELHRLLTV